MSDKSKLTISIVSHNQAEFIGRLLGDINKYCNNVQVILTLNIPENLPFNVDAYSMPIKLIKNEFPKGFATNHNAALKQANSEFLCVLNPDVRLLDNPFELLLENFSNTCMGIVAPRITNSAGVAQDSARKFPSPWSLFKRVMLNKRESDYFIGHTTLDADWVAGTFIVFRKQIFEQLAGFDEQFFLYCEDIDICARVHALGYQVLFDPKVTIIHNAQKDSHRKIRYLQWHVSSMLRFFYKYYLKKYKHN